MIAFNIAISYSLFTNKKQTTIITDKYWDCDFQINYLIENQNKLITFSKLQYHAENQQVDNVKLYDKNNKELFLQDLLSNRPKLIYYYSEKSCTGCFEPFLYKLDSISNYLETENIIIISNFSNYRSLKASIKNKYKNINIYRTEEKIKIIDTSDYDYAYAFLIKANREAHKIIITDKINTDFTNEYLNYIADYFKYIHTTQHGK